MENINIEETIELENIAQIEQEEQEKPLKEKNKPTKVVFASIVLLGVLGTVCFILAMLMGDAGIYNGASLDMAKSNFYHSQYSGRYHPIVGDIITNNAQNIENYFENSNLVGITHTASINDSEVLTSYGNTSESETLSYDKWSYNYNSEKYECFTIHILKYATRVDGYSFNNNLVEFIYKYKHTIWIVGILIGVAIMVLYVYLLKITDYKPSKIYSAPIEINFICAMCLGALFCFFAVVTFTNAYNFSQRNGDYLYYLGNLFFIALAEIVFLSISMDITVRVKSKTLWKNSIIGMLARIYIKIFRELNIIWKYVIVYCVYGAFSLVTFFIFDYAWAIGPALIYFIGLNVVIFPLVMHAVIGFVALIKASEKISKGDYDYKINDKYMYWGFKKLSTNLNNISSGMELALQEKLKSELLKTELITNVSHDIKTPLTSIINYSDLICKENSNNEKITEYSEVLHRQSIKLKKLIDDLIEASKASSGNINVSIENVELSVLIEQVIGEYHDKLSDSNLELITKPHHEDVSILADGRLLSRVFDNLFSNVLKYSLEGTRVYFDVEVNITGEIVIIELKNTSKYQLNIDEDLLTERFIRGDLSRNSEGSGLGLSIAKNLTTSQGGAFDISIDGDLFKVIIKFPTNSIDI